MATALDWLGRYEEAKRVSADCLTVADQVLERRPGYRLALHAEQVLTGTLVSVANDQLDPQAGQPWAVRQQQVSLTLLKLDPNNVTSLNNMAVAENQVATPLWAAGRLREALAHRQKALEYSRLSASGGATFAVSYSGFASGLVWTQALLGDSKGATAMVASVSQVAAKLRESEPGFSTAPAIAEGWLKVSEATIALQQDELPAVRHIAADAVRQLEAIRNRGELVFWKALGLHLLYDLEGRAAYLSGDFDDAERSEMKSAEARKAAGIDATDDRRRLQEVETWRAMAQVRQGHVSEAAQTIAPVVKFQRGLAAHNRGDRWQPQELAAALYVQALTDQSKRAALLHEAAGLIDALPSEIRAVRDVQRWRQRILEAR